MKVLYWILAGMLSINSVNCLAQQQDSVYFSLREALAYTKKHYPEIKAREAQVASAKYSLQASRTSYLPDLNAMEQVTRASDNGLNGTYFSGGGMSIPTSGSVRSSNSYQGTFGSFSTLLLNWNVFNFGKVRAQVNVYNSLFDQSQAVLANEIFQAQVKVADAYLLLLIDEKLANAQERNIERAKVFLTVVQAGTASGMRPGVDSSVFQAEYSKAKILLLQSRGEVAQQKNRLVNVLGLADTRIGIDTSYFNSVLPDLGGQISSGGEQNPVLVMYRAQVNLTGQKAKFTRSSYLPQLSFLAGAWGRGSGIDRTTDIYSSSFSKGFSYQTYNYLLGLTFSWNVTSLFRRGKEYRAALEDVKRDEAFYDAEKLEIERDLTNSRISADVSLKQAQEAPVQLVAARNAYQQADARYSSGLSSIPELAQSYYLLNRAEIDQLVATNNVWRALLSEAASSGNLDLFLKQIK